MIQARLPGAESWRSPPLARRARHPRLERLRLTAALLLLASCARRPEASTAQPVRVAAAADLTAAFAALGPLFEQQRGQRVSFTFGSTGLLAMQVREGAPFDLFASASAAAVDDVVAAGACVGSTRASYARGRLVVWTRAGLGPAPASLAELADARFTRIALANPDHAPYGQAAKEALSAAGLWEALRPRLVLGENVRQALQFAESGNAEAALIALALVKDLDGGTALLVDDALHRPLVQTLVGCRNGANAAGGQAFADFVRGPVGSGVLQRYGFVPEAFAPP